MRAFFDTNVLLDVLLARSPWSDHAERAWYLAETKVTGYVSALSYANVYYVVHRHADRAVAEEALRLIRGTFTLVPFDQAVLDQAMAFAFPDFEDAIQYFSARKADADCILTRNAGHFVGAAIPVLSPEQFLVTYRFE